MSTVMNVNKQFQSSQKYQFDNEDQLNNGNNEASNKSIYGLQQRSNIANRKTSKRREAQQEKAAVLQVFKDLLSIVNQKFLNAYQSPSEPKLPKTLKIQKSQSKMSKKNFEPGSAVKTKKQQPNIINSLISTNQTNNRPVVGDHVNEKRQKQQNCVLDEQNNHRQIKHNNNHHNHHPTNSRKGSESYIHRQRERSLNEKNQLLKEHLFKQIMENYSLHMKYIIHSEQEMSEEQSDSKQKQLRKKSDHLIGKDTLSKKISKKSKTSQNQQDKKTPLISPDTQKLHRNSFDNQQWLQQMQMSDQKQEQPHQNLNPHQNDSQNPQHLNNQMDGQKVDSPKSGQKELEQCQMLQQKQQLQDEGQPPLAHTTEQFLAAHRRQPQQQCNRVLKQDKHQH